jgi:hypothetical protein
MEPVQKIALEKLLKSLGALGCKFAVVDPEGVKHGDLEIAEPTQAAKRSPLKHAYGELKRYVDAQLDGIAVGAVINVPKDKFDLETLQSSCGHVMRLNFGSDSYMTTQANDKTHVQVLRLL